MADIFKLQGTVDVETGRAEASLKRVDSAAKGTQSALSQLGDGAAKSQGKFSSFSSRAVSAISTIGVAARKSRRDLDDFNDGIDVLQRKAQGLRSVGQALSVAITAPLVAAGVLATKTAASLEAEIANIKAIKPDLDASKLFSTLNEMQTRVPQTSQQIAAGVYNIFSSLDNISQEGATKLAENFAKGATAARTDTEKFGTAVIGVMNAYGLGVESADHISDVFFNTVNRGVVTGEELATELGNVAKQAKQAGVSFDDLGGMIVAATKEGGPAAQNINDLSNFLAKITAPAKTAIHCLSDDVRIAPRAGHYHLIGGH